MFGQPVARVGSGNENSARQLLDTVASVAADPDGYKQRLAELDAAQVKSLEAETKARQAERDAKDALDTLRSERQPLEAERKRAREEKDAGIDEIRKARAKHDAIVETERNALKREGEVLAQRTAEVAKLKADLDAKIEIHTKATAEHEAERRKAEALNADLAKALEAANAREAAAARAIARVKALASEAP